MKSRAGLIQARLPSQNDESYLPFPLAGNMGDFPKLMEGERGGGQTGMLFSQYVEMEVVPALTFVRCMQGGRYNKTHSLTTSLHSLPVIILPMMQMGQRRGEGVYGTYQDKSPRMFPNPPSYMNVSR